MTNQPTPTELDRRSSILFRITETEDWWARDNGEQSFCAYCRGRETVTSHNVKHLDGCVVLDAQQWRKENDRRTNSR